MATQSQILSLIKSHFENNSQRFTSFANIIADHENRLGHKEYAARLREYIKLGETPKVIKLELKLKGMVFTCQPEYDFPNYVIDDSVSTHLHRLFNEYEKREVLKSHGLTHRRKLMLYGEPGTGKTLTASIIAGKLKLPLNIIQIDHLVSSYLGETAAKLRQIFELIKSEHGVYFFDEFDAVGGDRSRENDVGEMRRVLNSFLQFIEQDQSDCLIIAATNNREILDKALFRRFDDVILFELPNESQREELIKRYLGKFMNDDIPLDAMSLYSVRLSHSEIASACNDAVKAAILSNQEKIDPEVLLKNIEQREDAKNLRK